MSAFCCFPIRKSRCRHEWDIRADEAGVTQSRAGQEDLGAERLRGAQGREDRAEEDAREEGKFKQSPFH